MDFALILLHLLSSALLITGDYYHPRSSASKSRYESRTEETDASFWNDMAQSTLAEHIDRTANIRLAKNIIMFLGDGMSLPTLTATRILKGGEQSTMIWEELPYVGLSKTYCVDFMVGDSACTASAYLCGVKANLGTIGVTAAVNYGDCAAMRNTSNHIYSIIHKAQLAGMSTGIVTTTRVTHASPAGVYAHAASRNWEDDNGVRLGGEDPDVCDDIAEMLIRGDTGSKLKVVFGGGRSYFRPTTMIDEEGQRGRRRDGVDLIDEWQNAKTTEGATWGWAWDRASLETIDVANTDYIMGLFETSHLEYHLDNNATLKPSLPELTRIAISKLQENPLGFVLFVEGGRIDHAHHENRAQYAMDETLQFDEAIRVGLEMTSPADTLVVVTSDHAHTMSINGYPARGGDLIGIAGTGRDRFPYSTLSYGNGPGYKHPTSTGDRYDISNDTFTDAKYEYPGVAPIPIETHGGDDVGVFASGPWAHLFSGTYEQNFIPHAMGYAACLGEGLTSCGNTWRHYQIK